MKTTVDLARQLRKCTGYMLPSLVYPAISSTKFASLVVRHSAGRKRAGSRDHMFSVFVHCSGCTQLFRVGYILWIAALVVQCSGAMFCQFLEVSIFLTYFCPIKKIETSRNWQNMASLHCTRSAASYKFYPTLNKCMQPELWTKNGERMSHR